MLQTNNLTLQIGKDPLFEDVTIKFLSGNCYGLIGANGAGKSTFLRILAGKLEPTKGYVSYPNNLRLSFLQQDHFKFDDYSVIETVIMGNQKLYRLQKEMNEIYAKPDFSDEDGIKAGELAARFDDMGGWNAESDAAILLSGLGVETAKHDMLMSELPSNDKVKVLLAQALFGNPDILLLDEPTNHLDPKAVRWLEEFLIDFDNTIIVVSHDRYFLNKVCTHIADIDYNQINLYTGNYDFWYESSQLMLKQQKEANKKAEEKIKELQEFIARFSANASKSKQATSRKKALDKIELNEIKPSTRRYPYVNFKVDKPLGDEVLKVENLCYSVDGQTLLNNVNFIVGREDKVAFVGDHEKAKTALFKILAGEIEPTSGEFKWGATVRLATFEKDHNYEFDQSIILVDWLKQFSTNQETTHVRGFLGRMLFSGDDSLKNIKVLSGGEKVRALLSKMMIQSTNTLILDEPTNHLDMESITALNKGLQEYQGVILFASTDHQLVSSTATRLIKVLDNGQMKSINESYDEYLNEL